MEKGGCWGGPTLLAYMEQWAGRFALVEKGGGQVNREGGGGASSRTADGARLRGLPKGGPLA